MVQRPKHLASAQDDLMTNFDNSIDRDVRALVDAGTHYGAYTARDFMGYIWKTPEGYTAEIWCFHVHVDTIVASTLEELKAEASATYGGQ